MDRNDYYGGDSASLNLTQVRHDFYFSVIFVDTPPILSSTASSDQTKRLQLSSDVIATMLSTSSPSSSWRPENSPRFSSTPTSPDTSNSSRSLAASFIAMARSPRCRVRRWRQSRVLSWVCSRSVGRRSSSSSCRDGKMRTLLLTKVCLLANIMLMLAYVLVLRIGVNLDKDSMKAIYEKFGLEPGTQDFIGHAMALYLDDEYVHPNSCTICTLRSDSLAATRPSPRGKLTNALSFTPHPWLAGASLHISTLSTVSENFPNLSPVCLLFTAEPTCSTSP